MISQRLPAHERARLTDIRRELAAIEHVRSIAKVSETEEGAPISALAKALSEIFPIEIIALIFSFMLHPPRQGKPG